MVTYFAQDIKYSGGKLSFLADRTIVAYLFFSSLGQSFPLFRRKFSKILEVDTVVVFFFFTPYFVKGKILSKQIYIFPILKRDMGEKTVFSPALAVEILAPNCHDECTKTTGIRVNWTSTQDRFVFPEKNSVGRDISP